MKTRAQETVEQLTRQERSQLCYAESCAVDGGGLMEIVRMNAEDLKLMATFQSNGLLRWGRVPSHLLQRGWTHWCELTDLGWEVAALCRRKRAEQRGPVATAVFEEVER